MSEFSTEKIRELLSDPKNIELIAGIAGGMSSGGFPLAGLFSNNKTPPENQNTPADNIGEKEQEQKNISEAAALTTVANTPVPQETSAFSPNSFQPVLSQIKSGDTDRRIALLRAIKPYISDSKKERVDGLMRAISVAGILNNYKGGLFGDKM